MLEIHHLSQSRSGRVIWLAEELGLEYHLERYERAPATPPPSQYKALHSLGRSPIIHDAGRIIVESGAIFEYLLGRYGAGRLVPDPSQDTYLDYLQWFHFAEGSLSPHHLALWVLDRAGQTTGETWDNMMESLAKDMAYANATLAARPYIAGDTFTAADIMISLPLLAPKQFAASLPAHPHVEAYLDRLSARPAYKRAKPFS